MQLRPRQELFVEKNVAALKERGNTLGVAPTGAGKTVMGSAIIGRMGGTQLVLQHRDELVDQNRKTYHKLNRGARSDLFTADRKRWEIGGATFAMAQTLARNLERIPPIDVAFIDEAHHVASAGYMNIIRTLREQNPDIAILGLTATPNRGDKRALRMVFDNVADQISIRELIAAGFLVRPRTFVIDLGVGEQLSHVTKRASDFDMQEVEAIMDHEVINERVVEEWKKVAGDRRTVAFASTVAHAEHVAEAFRAGGVDVSTIDGDMAAGERAARLAAFDRGEIQVLINVMVLTEGWDCQPVSCVLLLRPASYKSTMIQMIGRGLRTVDPDRYPGIVKDDCIVIDFGTSILLHGSLDQDVSLDGSGTKDCPECNAVVPTQCPDCPICGYVWPKPLDEDEAGAPGAGGGGDQRAQLSEFRLTEVDLINLSPYQWEPFHDGVVTIASAFDAWAAIVHYHGRWHAIGGMKGEGVKYIANNSERIIALAAADDFIRERGDSDGASKTRRWLSEMPTDKQLQILQVDHQTAVALGLTRYRATCGLTWKFNERAIRARLEGTRLAA